MINRIKIHLDKKFITKRLESETLTKVLAGEHPSVLHRLYLIANEVKEEQHFMELDHDVYQCSAKIKTKFVYAEDARRQAETISFMKDRLKNKHSHKIVFRIYEKVGMREVFKFDHETSNSDDLINMINILEQKTKEICQKTANTY